MSVDCFRIGVFFDLGLLGPGALSVDDGESAVEARVQLAGSCLPLLEFIVVAQFVLSV